MERVKLTVSQALIRYCSRQKIQLDTELPQQFIQGIGAIFGHGNVLGLGQAIYEAQKDFFCFVGRNEQGMGHIGIGFAKQKNRLGAYLITSSIGPGSTNLVTAAATATINNLPLLLVIGDVFSHKGFDPVLQQLEVTSNDNVSVADAFAPVCAYFAKITSPHHLLKVLPHAFTTLINPQTCGCVCLALSQDVGGMVYDFPLGFFLPKTWTIPRIPPSKNQVQTFWKLLQTAQQPLVICGGGAKYSHAQKALLDFVNQTKIPVAFSQAAKGMVVETEGVMGELNLGGIGVLGTLCANEYAKTADFVLNLGTRLSDFTIASNTLFANANLKIVNVNVKDFDAIKLNPTLSIQADVKAFLTALNTSEKPYTNPSQALVQKLKANWQQELNKIATCSLRGYWQTYFYDDYQNGLVFSNQFDTDLIQAQLVLDLQKYLPSNSIVVSASGSLPADLQRLWQVRSMNSYHLEYGYSCMGYEVAGGIGAKLANPNHPVFVFVGDGGFHMLHSELITALENDIKIIVLLFDNASFGCIDNLQTSCGCARFLTCFQNQQGRFLTIDYVKLVQAYGLDGVLVKHKAQVKNAIMQALNAPKTFLIDFKIPPKTMSVAYETYWGCGLNHGLQNYKSEQALKTLKQHLHQNKRY